MDRDQLQFYARYVSRFAGGFGLSALALLLPKYANELVASDLVVGLFYTGFTATQALVAVRGGQGVLATGMGLLGLSLVGELASKGTRASHTGKANAWRFAASLFGFAAAGTLHDRHGVATFLAVLVHAHGAAALTEW